MSGNTSEEKNNLFRDYYKIDNFDDNDLQSRLYAEIYYESNIEIESRTTDIPRTIQFDSITDKLNIEQESIKRKAEDKQLLEPETTRDKTVNTKERSEVSIEHNNENTLLSKESSIIEPLVCYDTLHIQNSADSYISVGIQKSCSTEQIKLVQTNNDKPSSEMNPMVQVHNITNNENSGDSPMIQGKVSKESCVKKLKLANHRTNKHQENSKIYSKYNVLQKCEKLEMLLAKQTDKDKISDSSSDSEESIFEVPVPPKPKPPLINLQDSDEEGNTNSGIDNDLILKKSDNTNVSKNVHPRVIAIRSPELEIIEVVNSHQDTSSKNKRIDKSPCNKHTPMNTDKSMRILTRELAVKQDIMLNCTNIQRGARNISEIKQLSKTTEIDENQRAAITEDTIQNSKKKSPQNKTKRNNESNANFQQETSAILPRKKFQMKKMQLDIDESNKECNMNNIRHVDYDLSGNTLMEVSCSDNNLVINRKRQHDSEVNSNFNQKRQCAIQQNNPSVMPQDNNSKKKGNDTWNEYFFKPMSEKMRNYYNNSTRGQENFDIGKLQRRMSKDPRVWAILDEDIMRRPFSSPRQRINFRFMKCSNCHQVGHQQYNCSESFKPPCCYICGTKGHIESNCAQKMCLTCGKQQKRFRKTCETCRILFCTMCSSVGHKPDQCPDLWRRYHQTTDMRSTLQNPGCVMKPPNLLYCCNCAKRGHESSRCKEFRWSEHFPTPATVTNYTYGPRYTPNAANSSGPNPETDISYRITNNKTLISQSSKHTQRPTREYLELSTNTNALSCNINNASTLQETVCISETEGGLGSSSMVDKTLCFSEEKQKRERKNGVKEKEFINIIYSCGTFHDKDNKHARMILHRFPMFNKMESSRGINSLVKHKVIPAFLKTLFDKEIEFQVTIGFTICDRNNLVLQLIGMEWCIKEIYKLLLHWIELPDDEKDYGVDVTLPLNTMKMYNLLSTRLPQLEKNHFTCYHEHVKGPNNPRFLFQSIQRDKNNLKEHKGTIKQYYSLRKRLWRTQCKLLMIVNTEPKPNKFVREFQIVMKMLDKWKRDETDERLDSATYLRLTLLYNYLFVPHTSTRVHMTLHRIENYAKTMIKDINCLLQTQQELKKRAICDQGNSALHTNASPSLSCASSVILQDINFTENPSTVDIQQKNIYNNISVEREDVNDTLPNTSDRRNRNCNEIIMNNSTVQDNQMFIPLDTVPVSVQSEDPGRSEDRLSTNEMSTVLPNILVGKRNINMKPTINTSLTKKQTRKLKKYSTRLTIKYNTNKGIQHNISLQASKFIKEARKFQKPHMIKAANELQRKIDNQMIKKKHINSMKKLIKLEKKHQKNINSYCNDLKA